MKKYFLYSGILFINFWACSQKKENTMNDITEKNIVDKITAQVKRYPKEPFYYVYIGNSLCIYEFFVNDLPIEKHYEYSQIGTPIYINNGILKSGRQKITYRIYPAPKEYNEGKDVFDFETEFNVKVYVNDNARDLRIGEEKLILKHEAPTKIRMAGRDNDIEMKEFVGKGQKYYEHTFYFDAEIPYENEGWSNGQDLRKLDQKQLERAVIDFYLDRRKEIEKKDLDAIARRVYTPLKEQFIAEYSDKASINIAWTEELVYAYKSPTYQLQPFKDYKMVFYGDGKMVALEHDNPSDARLRGQSALWGLFIDKEGVQRADFNGIKLSLPQGKGLNELKAVR